MEVRQAVPGKDDDFLFDVYASWRLAEVAAWGWKAGQQLQFLRMQHMAQQRSYRQRYPDLQYQIVLVDGMRAGRMATVYTKTELVLVDIILLPAFQHRGLGTSLVLALQEQAAARQVSLSLSVLTSSSAQQFYLNCGCKVVMPGAVYTSMKWDKKMNGEKTHEMDANTK